MTKKLKNIEAAWSDVFLKKKKRVLVIQEIMGVDTIIYI